MKTSYCLFVLCILGVHQQAKGENQAPLLGRPDGHEPGSQHTNSAESDGNAPLLGRHDGHEPESWLEVSKDVSDEDLDASYDYGDEVSDTAEELEIGEEEEEPEEEDSEEPLVRCKRPLCLMYCKDGFETDSSGCPTCQCKTSDSSLIGRPDGHEPQVADCDDRAMCEMVCENGFKTGDDGCPICECNHTQNDDLLGGDDGHELSADCANQPICRMFCELGFQTDERGCSVCKCLENPCELIDCRSDSVCQSQPCDSQRSCTRLTAKCVPVGQTLPCPEPMCANACPDGYLKNDRGCMTCDCAPIPDERQCGPVTCEKGQICRNTTDSSVPKCTVKTFCEIHREQPVVLGSTSLQCEADGSFKPLQCNSPQAECWCVDGLGQEISDTRSTVYVDEHKPKCVRNITVSMHIHLTFVVKHDVDIVNKLGSLNSTIIDHVSSWLLIEPHFVKVVKAEPLSSDERHRNSDDADDSLDLDADDDDSDEDDSDDASSELDGPRQLVIELVVLHDGQSDLPSAANYMRQRMHQGLCDIPVEKGSLLPNPYSLKTEHQFAQPWANDERVIGEPDRCVVDPDSWYCWRRQRIGICSIGTALLTLFVITILLVVSVLASFCHRRRMRTLAFRHRMFDSQTSVDKSFLDDDSNKPLPVGEDNYSMKEEKQPIA